METHDEFYNFTEIATAETIESLISRIALFAPLKGRDRKRLAEILLASQTEYPPNTILFYEGDPGDSLYIIVNGEVEQIKALGTEDQRILRVYGPGEHIGEMTLLAHGRRRGALRTRSHVRMLELSSDYFEILLLRYPSLVLIIAKGIIRRYRDLENRLLPKVRVSSRKPEHLSEPAVKPELNVQEPQVQFSLAKQRRSAGSVRPDAPRLYIQTLGDFKVWRGESLIEEQEWKGNQRKLLLKAIVTRLTPVPREVLIEDLWPEALPGSGEANFKFVLHQLRKILEPGLPRGARSSYIILKTGVVTLDRTLCGIDLDNFLLLFEKGRKAAEYGALKSAHFFLSAARDLYRGDFLPEDLYVSWAAFRRQELQKSYIDLLVRSAELYESEGNSKKAIECHTRIIEIDPLFEKSYQRLMLLYSQRGQCATALKVFEDFKKYLWEEFGVRPDKLTVSIYESVLNMPAN